MSSSIDYKVELELPSKFKMFVSNKYFEYKDECSDFKDTPQSRDVYIRNNKWFLKNLYKEK